MTIIKILNWKLVLVLYSVHSLLECIAVYHKKWIRKIENRLVVSQLRANVVNVVRSTWAISRLILITKSLMIYLADANTRFESTHFRTKMKIVHSFLSPIACLSMRAKNGSHRMINLQINMQFSCVIYIISIANFSIKCAMNSRSQLSVLKWEKCSA